MSPDSEGFEDGQKFFIVGVVVQFGSAKRPRVERDRMDFTGVELEGKDSCDSVIGCVGFDNNLLVRLPMGEYRSRGKCVQSESKDFWQVSVQIQGTPFLVNLVSGITM